MSRAFGTFSLLNGIIRLYGAYCINDPHVYAIVMFTYAVALFHFSAELLVYGTAELGEGLAGPLIVASSSLAWMLSQWSFYIKQ
jgi:hypothetical protein